MPGTLFAEFAAVAGAVAATTSKLRKRDLLAAYLRELAAADVPRAATFFAGRPLPGVGGPAGAGLGPASGALQSASGADAEALRAAYLRHSDAGDAAADLLDGREPERRRSRSPTSTWRCVQWPVRPAPSRARR